MKIKCNLCNKESENQYTDVELLEHFRAQHDKILIASDSIVRIFKIHEKIESLEERSNWGDRELKKVGMYSEEHESTLRHDNNLVINELKSLLDNEKCQ